MHDTRQALRTIAVFALSGIGISFYALLLKQGVADGTACTIGETFDCDLVNQSSYSSIMGVPVSLLGIVGYAFMGVSAVLLLFKPHDRGVLQFLLLATTGGLLFSLYLTSIEAFILFTWCILCLTSQAFILSIFLMTLYVWRRSRSTAPSEE